VQRLRHHVVAFLRRQPVVFPLLLRFRRGRRELLASPTTDLVIDGYMRSANTFAYHAFRRGNPDAVVAHHLHSTLQFTRAARFGVPALLLVRSPDDAVASAVVQAPTLSTSVALREWTAFYRSVWPFRDQYVIGRFDEVTNEFSSVIRRVNDAFGAAFVEYESSEQSDAQVFDTIDRDFAEKQSPRSSEQVESFIGRPSEHRTSRLDDVKSAMAHDIAHPTLLPEALELYQRYCDEARAQVARYAS